MTITIQCDPGRSYIQGRNGLFDIYSLNLYITEEGSRVFIDGIGKRGTIINGGLCVDIKCFEDMIESYIRSRENAQ